MKNQIDTNILSRYLKGECSSEDQKYIDHIFSSEAYAGGLSDFMKADWDGFEISENKDERDLSPILHRLYYQIQKAREREASKKKFRIWKFYSKIAATILFPLAAACLIFSLLNQPGADKMTSYAEITAPLGARVNFNLPDGSTGWLNSGSTIRYPVQFADVRNVELVGEAYFDIIKNPSKPFNVKTTALNISVLGTKFNVSSYKGDSTIDVVLESGKVRLNQLGSSKYIEMKPNELVKFDIRKSEIIKIPVEPFKYSAWREGKLVFRNDTLGEVVKRLNRWYNVDIELDKEVTSDFRLRATFVDEEIEEVLKLIKLTFSIDYEIEERYQDKNGDLVKQKIRIRLLDKS